MLYPVLLLASSLFLSAPPVVPPSSDAIHVDIFVGGPARIALAGKGSGDISAEQWKAAKELTVQGCTPGAYVVGYTVSFSNGNGVVVEQGGKGSALHQPLKDAVAALPDGTAFSIVARVVDGKGNEVKVPAAAYVLRK